MPGRRLDIQPGDRRRSDAPAGPGWAASDLGGAAGRLREAIPNVSEIYGRTVI